MLRAAGSQMRKAPDVCRLVNNCSSQKKSSVNVERVKI